MSANKSSSASCVDVRIEAGPRGALKIRWLRELSSAILRGLELGGAELSLLITGDEEIHALNLQWRGKDKSTDVLSFPQDDGGAEIPPEALEALGLQNVDFKTQASGPQVLGDVIISIDTAIRQAESLGFTLEEEVTRLLIHGVLHLLGHDHVHGGRQAAKMKAEEKRILEFIDGATGHEKR